VDTSLIQNDMRKFRDALFDILNDLAARNFFRVSVVRLPKARFVDPVGFLEDPFAESESFEHLHCPASNTIRLPELQRPVLLLYECRFHARECGKLRCQRQARRSATNDQHIDLLENGIGQLRWIG
jgi:hypothetical protein